MLTTPFGKKTGIRRNKDAITSHSLATRFMLEICVENGVPTCAHDIF